MAGLYCRPTDVFEQAGRSAEHTRSSNCDCVHCQWDVLLKATLHALTIIFDGHLPVTVLCMTDIIFLPSSLSP